MTTPDTPEDVTRFIPPPSSEELTIWRYLDFTKFVALLDSRSLWFARVHTLDDPFEGSYPPAQTIVQRLRGSFPPGTLPPNIQIEVAPDLVNAWKAMRYWALVNCWHASEHESAAMWRLYSGTSAAVAIRSTVGQLRRALGKGPPPPPGFGGSHHIHIGMVKYIDFATDKIPDGSFAAQFYCKRRSFEHEKELRAMLLQFPLNERGERPDYDRHPADTGLRVPVSLPDLLGDVFVAPQAPRWYVELVSSVTKAYGFPISPRQSELDATPVY